MFCAKCGREIRDDSVYCSYCGVRIPDAEDEPQRPDSSDTSLQEQAPCIQPGAPKKKCLDCGRELPSSSVNDICALCTIRRRNRELDEERARRDREEDLREARRDRYDISDEYDFSVFSQDQAHYYHGDEPQGGGKPARRFRLPQRPKRQFPRHPSGEAPKKRGIGCVVWVVLAMVVLSTVLPALIGVGVSVWNSMISASVSPASPEPEFPMELEAPVDEGIASLAEESEPVLPEEWEESPAGEDWSWGPLPEADWANAPSLPGEAATQQELLTYFLFPELDYRLTEAIELFYGASQPGNYEMMEITVSAQEAQITLEGLLSHDEVGWLPFRAQFYSYPSGIYDCYLDINGSIYYDDNYLLNLDGTVTAEGAQFYGISEGESLLGELAIRWEDLPA